jgi:hypothetical protein
MTVGWADFLLYLVFAAGTAVSLFAYFWGRRVKTTALARQALRDDPAFRDILAGGLAVAGETDVDAPSAKALLELLRLQLENPLNYMHYAWAKVGRRTGQLHVDRGSDNEMSFTAEGLNIAEGLVRVAPGSTPGRLKVRWALTAPGTATLISVGQWWALLLGLTASVAVPIIVFQYVLTSKNPAVQAQFLQVLQVAQVLWEPYMFIGIGVQRMKWAGNYLEMLILAAAFEARTGRPAAAPGMGHGMR